MPLGFALGTSYQSCSCSAPALRLSLPRVSLPWDEANREGVEPAMRVLDQGQYPEISARADVGDAAVDGSAELDSKLVQSYQAF